MASINPILFEIFESKPTKGDLKKAAIVEYALESLATHGAQATSLESIAKALGLRRSHVAYYFPEKKHILLGAIKLAIATGQKFVVEKLRSIKNPKQQLKAYVEASFQWGQEYPSNISAILLLYYCATYDADFLELSRNFKSAGRQRILAILNAGWRDQLSASRREKLAGEVHNIVVAVLLEWFSTQPKASLKQYGENAYKSISQRLN